MWFARVAESTQLEIALGYVIVLPAQRPFFCSDGIDFDTNRQHTGAVVLLDITGLKRCDSRERHLAEMCTCSWNASLPHAKGILAATAPAHLVPLFIVQKGVHLQDIESNAWINRLYNPTESSGSLNRPGPKATKRPAKAEQGLAGLLAWGPGANKLSAGRK